MTYEDAITVVVGWVGSQVQVAVEDRASSATVMAAKGVLGHLETEDATGDDERIVLSCGNEAQLIIERFAFNGATGDESYLEVTLGDALVYMTMFSASDETTLAGSSKGHTILSETRRKPARVGCLL